MIQVLFVHQNFPGQFGPVVQALHRAGGFRIAAIGRRLEAPRDVIYYPYALGLPAGSGSAVIDSLTRRGTAAEAVAEQGQRLRADGFEPDVIVVHAGWGEGLLLRDIFPSARLICYCEYYYNRHNSDLSFDPEFPDVAVNVLHQLRGANAFTLATMDDADICISPTQWQKSTFPTAFTDKIQVLHEGIDVAALAPGAPKPMRFAGSGVELTAETPLVTYVARTLEPYRGFHTFMRALPALLAREAEAQVVIIGRETGGYGPAPPDGRTWRQVFCDELAGHLDRGRVHFAGWLDREAYINCLRLSRVHAYLTYPFVPSWSLLEAMAAGCTIAASDTPPVREFLHDGETARLVDFFKPAEWAEQIGALLQPDAVTGRFGPAARETILAQGLTREACAGRWLALIRSLAGRR